MFLEEDETGHINVPILTAVPTIDLAINGEGVGLRGITAQVSEDGNPMRLRIQMTNAAAMQALGLLLRYAEERGLDLPVDAIVSRPRAN